MRENKAKSNLYFSPRRREKYRIILYYLGMQHSSYHPIPMTVMMAPVMMTPIPYNNLQQMPQSNNM